MVIRTKLDNSKKQKNCWLHRSGAVGRRRCPRIACGFRRCSIWRRGRHSCSRRRRDCQPGGACCAMGALPKLTEGKNYLNNLDVYYSSYLDIH